MHQLRLLVSCFLLYIILFNNISLSYTDSSYIWSSYSDTISTSSSENTSTSVDLALECGSAILIEQTTRRNFI